MKEFCVFHKKGQFMHLQFLPWMQSNRYGINVNDEAVPEVLQIEDADVVLMKTSEFSTSLLRLPLQTTMLISKY